MGANYEQQWVESVNARLTENATAIKEVGKQITALALDLSKRRDEFERKGKELAAAMGIPILTKQQGDALNKMIAAELAREIMSETRARRGVFVQYWWAWILGSLAAASSITQILHIILA